MNPGIKRGITLSEKAIKELGWAIAHGKEEMIQAYLALMGVWQSDLNYAGKQSAVWMLFNSAQLFKESRALFYALLQQYGDHTTSIKI